MDVVVVVVVVGNATLSARRIATIESNIDASERMNLSSFSPSEKRELLERDDEIRSRVESGVSRPETSRALRKCADACTRACARPT